MSEFQFQPMRSLIYVNCVKEDFRPKLQAWLYQTHVPDSIALFEPYCTKYAFYPSFPIPEGAENYGYAKMQLTEHHWLINDCDPRVAIKAVTERFPMEVMVWQGMLPESALSGKQLEADGEDVGNKARSMKNEEGNPFIYCFLPMWWERNIKGAGRTLDDGPNYRFNMAIGFPEGVDKEEGEKWLFEKVVPVMEKADECTRIVASRVKKEINGCPMDFVLECWFEHESGWKKVMVEDMKQVEKPAWAMTDTFPYLKPYHNVISVAVADFTMSNMLKNYHGYVPMR